MRQNVPSENHYQNHENTAVQESQGLRTERHRPAQDRGMQATGSGQRGTGRLRTEAQRPSSWLTPLLRVRVPQIFSLFLVFLEFLYLSYV